MEEAATLLKNSLSDEQTGMLATLPAEIRAAVENTAKMGMATDNPIMKLITARLVAGENNFIQTQEFQDMSSTMAGQEMLKFAQKAASILENQGEDAFQSYLANQGVEFSQELIQMMSQSANRAAGIADGTMGMVGQVAEGVQTLSDFASGVTGGSTEDRAGMMYADQQVQAQVSNELAINELMPGFIDNVKNLTDTNRAFAEQAAKTIIANANVIDGFNNAATGVKQVVTTVGNVALKIMNLPGIIGDFTGGLFGVDGVFSNDTRNIGDFTSNKEGGVRTMNDSQARKFQDYTNEMIKSIKDNKEADRLDKAAAAQTLKNTLLSAMQGRAEEGSTEVDATQQRILAQLNALIKDLREN